MSSISEYRRFFSYIYAYEEQQKTKNAGFAKIESKGAVTTIALHLHDCHAHTDAAQLCLFVQQDRQLLGFPVGELSFFNGTAERRFSVSEEIFGSSGYHLRDAAGIGILCKGKLCFVSQWTEAPLAWQSFQIDVQAPPKTAAAAHMQAQPKQPLPPKTEPAPEAVIQSAELAMPQPVPQKSAKKSAGEVPTNGADNRWADMWEAISAAYPPIQPFSDQQISCVRVELKDLRLLPASNWQLCSNSFLLHAFFTYHHLIFGKLPAAKGAKYFVGVPGIRYRQEHVLAAIFGFSEFLPEQKSADSDTPFGYWYTAINESD